MEFVHEVRIAWKVHAWLSEQKNRLQEEGEQEQ
jgi:hypothetical protein